MNYKYMSVEEMAEAIKLAFLEKLKGHRIDIMAAENAMGLLDLKATWDDDAHCYKLPVS